MTVKELHDLLNRFIDNEFAHLKTKVDWIFYMLIAALITLIGNLIFMLCGK